MNKITPKRKLVIVIVVLTLLSTVIWTSFIKNSPAPNSLKANLLKLNTDDGDLNEIAGDKKMSLLFERSKVIGFGEATHGTKEFRQTFTALSKYLILHEGYKLIILSEYPFSQGWQLYNYVRGSKSPSSFLGDDNYCELADWIKKYNTTLPEEEKVTIAGADVFDIAHNAIGTLELIKEKGLSISREQQHLLEVLSFHGAISFDEYMKVHSITYVLNCLNDLNISIISELKAEKITSKEKWLLQGIKTLPQAVTFKHSNDFTGNGSRDSALYTNVMWLMENQPGAKVLILGHNAHVEKATGMELTRHAPARLGWMLSKKFKGAYKVIGTDVATGNYKTYWNNQEILVKVPESGNKIGNIIENIIGKEKINSALLDVHADSSLTDYFTKDHQITYAGSGKAVTGSYTVKNFANAFDILSWSRTSTPADPLSTSIYNLTALFMENDIKPYLQRRTLKARIKISYTTYTDSRSDIPQFTVFFLDGKNGRIKQQSSTIEGDEAEYEFVLPEQCKRVALNISGDKTEQISVKSLTLNGISVINRLKLTGTSYEIKMRDKNALELSNKLN